MPIRHHPSEATLFDYGGGALSEAFSLVVATHVSVCPLCRERLRDIEAIGGVMLETVEPVPLDGDAFARLAPRLDEPRAPAGVTPREAVPGDLDCRSFFDPTRLDRAPWRTVFPGVAEAELIAGDAAGSRAKLLRVRAGRALAHHGHGGRESTLVLRGGLTDEDGAFAVGDVAEHDRATAHRPVAEPGDDCVCLVALDAPLRFTGALRLLQPFLRI